MKRNAAMSMQSADLAAETKRDLIKQFLVKRLHSYQIKYQN